MPHLVRLCLMEKCLATKQASAVVYRQLAGWEPVTNATYYYLVKKIENFMSKAAKSITFEWIRVLKRFAPVFDGFVT